jgi:hypothetical protein
MDIEAAISAALRGRLDQHEFVDRLLASRDELVGSFATLVSSAAALAQGAAAARPSDADQDAVFRDLSSFLAANAAWRERALAISGRLDACTPRVQALHRRIHRETVNIAVIGMTKAGKSTLLRRVSGLGQEHIPSNRYDSTTATPSRIFHELDGRPDRAVLTLHTWASFRQEILVPLHERARIGSTAPTTLDGFRRFSYGHDAADVPAGEIGALRYRKRLREAQAALGSYESLLGRGTEEVALDRLRPFVAYPADGDPQAHYRPYHAVRSVDIFCAFPVLGAVRLGLIDLPGAGEAGLDVHGRFLADLRNNADLLLIVKRPEKTAVQLMDQDWDVMQLADEAAGGVRRSDFSHYVINSDSDVPSEYVRESVRKTRAEGERLGIDVRECDIEAATSADVMREILAPILSLLAERLTYMDRDAADQVLTDLAGIGEDLQDLAGELARHVGDWQGGLPSEKRQLRNRARKLMHEISLQLNQVRDEYDQLYQSGQPIAELHHEVEKAGREIRDWIDDGLGAGSAEAWLHQFRGADAALQRGSELDRQYNAARKKVLATFGGIDASLGRAVERLWGKVSTALREKLTEEIVPDSVTSSEHGAALRAFAERARRDDARTLAGAADGLLKLQTEYGSILLRVGRPVIRKIDWTDDGQQASLTTAVAAGLAGGAAGALAGSAVGTAVGTAAGPIAGAGAAHLASGATKGAVAALVGEGVRRAGKSGPEWWRAAASRNPAGAQSQSGEPTETEQSGEAPPSGTAPAARKSTPEETAMAQKYPEASIWHKRLTGTLERVTSELEREFHAEAQRTLLVLAAAVDLFKETAIATPDVDIEYENLCRPAQRKIWPHDFSEGSATVVADLAALVQQAQDTRAAAEQMTSLATQGRRL